MKFEWLLLCFMLTLAGQCWEFAASIYIYIYIYIYINIITTNVHHQGTIFIAASNIKIVTSSDLNGNFGNTEIKCIIT